MSDWCSILEVILAMVIIIIVPSFLSYRIGYEAGLVGLASGEYVCELVENKDKTTDWSCHEVLVGVEG